MQLHGQLHALAAHALRGDRPRALHKAPRGHAFDRAVARHVEVGDPAVALAPECAQDLHRPRGLQAALADLAPRRRALGRQRAVHGEHRQVALAQLIVRQARAGEQHGLARALLGIGQQLVLHHALARRNRAVPVDILAGELLAGVLLHLLHAARDQVLVLLFIHQARHPREVVEARTGDVKVFFLHVKVQRQALPRLLGHAAHAQRAHAAESLRALARARELDAAKAAVADDQRRVRAFLAHLRRQVGDEVEHAHRLHGAADAAAQAHLLAQAHVVERLEVLLPCLLIEEVRAEDDRVGGERRLAQLRRVVKPRLAAECARQGLRAAGGQLRHVQVAVDHPDLHRRAPAHKEVLKNGGGKVIRARAGNHNLSHHDNSLSKETLPYGEGARRAGEVPARRNLIRHTFGMPPSPQGKAH